MKSKLLAIAITALFAACTSNPKTGTQTTTTTTTTTDSAGFRNNSAADKGQVIELKGVSDTIVTGDGNRYVKVDPNQPKQNNIVSTTPPVAKTPTPTPSVNHSTARTHHRSGSRSTGGYSGRHSSGGHSGAGNQTASAPVYRKKGWSKAAKGAAIGAGAGAVAGAIISKNKGLGAVVGGVVGGAGGYIIGRNKDKKDGRY